MSVSLTVQLDEISLAPIENARKAITALINDQKLLSGNAFEIALGPLGGAVAGLKGKLPDGAALFKPIVDASVSVMGTLDLDSLPIDELAEAVSDGTNRVARMLEAVLRGQDLSALLSLDRVNQLAGELTRGITLSGSAGVGGLHALIDRADGALTEVGAIVDFALDALLPAGGAGILDLRAQIDAILAGVVQIQLPRGRFAGLIAALDLVAAAATQQQLDAALENLAIVRQATLEVLRGDLRKVRDAIELLRFDQVIAPVVAAANALAGAETGFLELLGQWQRFIADVRERLDEFDAERLSAFVERFTQMLEDAARTHFDKPMDVEIERAVEFVRGLFRDLPHRVLRAKLTAFLAAAAQAVRDAELDRVAKEARKVLDDLETAVSPATLTAEIEVVLQQVRDAAMAVLGPLETQLGTIGTAVEGVKTQLETVLGEVVKILEEFSGALANVTAAIDGLGIEEATAQVVATLRELRGKAEALLSAAPVPEPLRPAIEQVISTLEGLDFDVVLAPVRSAADQLQIPPAIAGQVEVALKAVSGKLENAIPAQLIKSIDTEVENVLDTIRNLDPAKLLEGVDKYLDEAAVLIERLDPTAAAATIAPQFKAVLDAIDSVHPRKLLAPVIDGYNAILANVPMPGDPDQLLGGFTTAINRAGASVTQQLMTPVAQLTGATANVGGAAPAAGQAQAIPSDLRAGDVIRLLGWLPKKLREALMALPQTAAGDVLARIDGATTGLSRDLRAIRRRVLELETRIEQELADELAAVGSSQVRAQLAVSVNVPGVQVDASLTAAGMVSPGELRAEVLEALNEIRAAARDAAGSLGGSTAAALERAASALEVFDLGRASGSIDSFLAALDPEPVAVELDALCDAFIAKMPELITGSEAALRAGMDKIRMIVEQLGPAAQANKIFRVLEVLREELSVLDPAVLADELGAIHAAIRAAVAAYDPAVLAKELKDVVTNLAASVRSLTAANLLGDLDLFDDVLAKLETANPAKVLEGVGANLKVVGDKLAALNPRATLALVNGLPGQVIAAFETAVETIRAELIALLESIRYASANAQVTVSGSVST